MKKTSIILIIILSLFVGAYGYQAMQKGGPEGIDGQAELQEEMIKKAAKDIITAQTNVTYELIQKALDDNDGTLSDEESEDILNRLSRHTVGKTGYVWILDYEGNYVLSKNRERDGEDIWEVEDADGNMVIQDLVGKGKAVSGDQIAYHSYPWSNIGESEPREKIAAMIHFAELEWVVGVCPASTLEHKVRAPVLFPGKDHQTDR